MEPTPYLQIDPSRSMSYIEKLLGSNSQINIWKLVLLTQDEIFYLAEKKFLEGIGFFKEAQTVLDLSWGKGQPVASRVEKFSRHKVQEVGISYDYLFAGSAKAKRILSDISDSVPDPGQKYDWIRIYLVAQMVRHHGILLEGLHSLLNDGGSVLVVDTRDEFMDFSPDFKYLRNMYDQLNESQKKQGGIRTAAERIKKRANEFGFKLTAAQNIRCQTHTEEDKEHFFRMYCVHVEMVTRWFPGKFDRIKLFEDVRQWYESESNWGSLGLQCVSVQKRSRPPLRR